MGEESGSPGLTELCESLRDELAADLLIGSDGPRLAADRPTVFLGSRGSMNLTFRVTARERAHHSGNWGGVLVNPATVLVERARLARRRARPAAGRRAAPAGDPGAGARRAGLDRRRPGARTARRLDPAGASRG